MIGATIETDLIGELIEVLQPYREERPLPDGFGPIKHRVTGRGRCRAVTVNPQGDMILWLEIVDAKTPVDLWQGVDFAAEARPAIGDVYRVTINDRQHLRLLKEAT